MHEDYALSMKTKLFSAFLLCFSLFGLSQIEVLNEPIMKNLHDFEVLAIDGTPYSLESLKGKKVMIVNVASECGLTPQYEQLQELYDTFGGETFQIIGFPANNFGAQEPGSEAEIAIFCSKNYGVTFPLMSKISVKGDDQHPLYQWLTREEQNGVADFEMLWNFQKFLIDEDGNVVRNVHPDVLPTDESILAWIES